MPLLCVMRLEARLDYLRPLNPPCTSFGHINQTQNLLLFSDDLRLPKAVGALLDLEGEISSVDCCVFGYRGPSLLRTGHPKELPCPLTSSDITVAVAHIPHC